MPFIYIYSPSDFVGGLPDEVGSRGDVSTPFSLELVPGAVPTRVEISDDDAGFNELDPNQSFTNTVTVDGTTFQAGQGIFAAYDLENSVTGLKVTTFTTGANGGLQGPVSGLVATQPLIGGTTYTFDTNVSSNGNEDTFDTYVACFAEGTMIETADGEKAIEDIRAGDMVKTRENGLQPVRWLGSRHVSQEDMMADPALKPVVLSKGAYGTTRDLTVSAEHRMLMASPEQEVLLGLAEALVPAKTLVDGTRVKRDCPEAGVTYHHMLFDRHEIVTANGAESESFHPSARTRDGLDQATRGELLKLFPQLATEAAMNVAAPILANSEAALATRR